MLFKSFNKAELNLSFGLKVNFENNKLLLQQIINNKEIHSSLIITEKDFIKKTKLVILFSPLKGLLVFNHDWLFKSKSNWSLAEHAFYAKDVVANIYFNNTFEDSYLFVNIIPISNLDFEVIPSPQRVHDYFKTQIPDDIIANNTNLRIETVGSISDIDSIVALEQQVDLLSKLVFALINKSEIPEWSKTFIKNVEEYSVDKIKNTNEIIKDFSQHKQFVRTQQYKYLTNKK